MTEFINGSYKITDGQMFTDFENYECVVNKELATLNEISVGDTISLKRQIADLFGVSQSTVAQAVKEAKLRVRINELERQLSPVKKEVLQLDRIDVLELPEITDTTYRRKL